MSLVQKVTVKELLPVFTMKDNAEANSIELLHCEEHDYDLIVGKGLYTIGQELLYIFPDSNLKEGHSYLDEYIFPKDKDGNPLSSKLGGFNRVKAIPFNFHTGDFNKLYSNGIVCPIDDTIESFVYKHEVVESNNGTNAVGAEKDFPEGFYKTDEKNFKQIGRSIEYPFHAIGTQKKDGSSMSLYGHFNGKRGILSRNVEKPLTVRKVVSINYNWVGRLLRKIGVKPWSWTVEKIYQKTESDSEFVKLGKPILDKFVTLFPKLNAMVSGVLTEGFVLRGYRKMCIFVF